MRWFIVDLKRALTERTFIASVTVGCVVLMMGLVTYLMQETDIKQAQEAFVASQSLIMPFIAPILAALPYSNMSMLEKDTGYKRLILTKNKMKTYKGSRFIVNAIVGGLAITLPLVVLAGLCGGFSPYSDYEAILRVIGLDFWFGAAYASIAYGLTFVNTKRYIPLVAPQVLYLLFIYAFPYLNLEKFYPPLAFSPWLLPTYAEETLLLLQLGLMILGSALIVVGAHIYEKLEGLR